MLVNVVDVPPLCNFILPAIVRTGPLAIAISTAGASPALAKRIETRSPRSTASPTPRWPMMLNEVRGWAKGTLPDLPGPQGLLRVDRQRRPRPGRAAAPGRRAGGARLIEAARETHSQRAPRRARRRRLPSPAPSLFRLSSASAVSDFRSRAPTPMPRENLARPSVNWTSEYSTTCTWFPHGSRKSRPRPGEDRRAASLQRTAAPRRGRPPRARSGDGRPRSSSSGAPTAARNWSPMSRNAMPPVRGRGAESRRPLPVDTRPQPRRPRPRAPTWLIPIARATWLAVSHPRADTDGAPRARRQ